MGLMDIILLYDSKGRDPPASLSRFFAFGKKKHRNVSNSCSLVSHYALSMEILEDSSLKRRMAMG